MATTKTAIRTDRPQQSLRTSDHPSDLGQDLVEYLKEYAREKPEVAALWCFGIGFIIGWKLKPW